MWKLLALALAAASCAAQSPELAKFYKLDFIMKEVENNKVIASHAYSLMVSNDKANSSSLRAGSKVPVEVVTNSIQFYDAGVNIDCRNVREENNELSLYVTAEISTTIRENPANERQPPVMRQNKWSSMVLIPLRKPTVIFSSDDPSSKRQMQFELTATPVK